MERHKNLPVNFSVQQPGGLELTEALCLELDFILLKTIMEPLLWFLGNYISLETKSKMKKQTEAHKRAGAARHSEFSGNLLYMARVLNTHF